MGDNAYPTGSARDFAICFTPSWGDSDQAHHEEHPAHAGQPRAPHRRGGSLLRIFRESAGSPTKGYYSYDVGAWHVIVLNSEIVVNGAFTGDERQAQEDWLAADLKSNTQKCTLAYWHHPRFSSGWHGVRSPHRRVLADPARRGVDLILNGHDHDYERFLPQSPTAVVDSLTGHYRRSSRARAAATCADTKRIAPNSATRIQGHFGVLMLTLGAAEWRSAFLDVNGMVWDQTDGVCH